MSFIAFLANPAFWTTAASAAGAYGAAGGFGGGDGGGGGGISTMSTLSPEQQEIMSGLGEWLLGGIGQGLPAWGGPFTAPLSPYQESGLSMLDQYISGGLGPTAQMGIDAYQQALTGMSPEEVSDYYMTYIAPGEQQYLENVTIPTFKESMVPGGTLRSTGTEGGIADIISQFGTGQLGRIGDMIMGQQEISASMIPYLSEIAGIEGGVPQMEAAFQYGALPQILEQQELTAQIQSFMTSLPELNPLLQTMLQYLNIGTMAAYGQPSSPSPFASLLGQLGPDIGNMIGQLGFSSGGGGGGGSYGGGYGGIGAGGGGGIGTYITP